MDFGFVKSQTVCHNGNTTEGHGQGGQDGVQLPQHERQGFKRVEGPGGNRDQDDIVAEGPEKVLFDRIHGGAAESDSPGHTA